MTHLYSVVVLSALLVSIPASVQLTIAGHYGCEGINPDGSTYKGQVEIVAQGDLWSLRWDFGNGASGAGIGLLDAEGILSVIFQTSEGAIGLASYRVEREGSSTVRLVGRWTVPGDPAGRVLTEVLTLVSLRAGR